MFDKTIINRSECPSSIGIDIHEHRAPTDKSVELLREMEEAARGKLISACRLDSNEFKATWHCFERPDNLDGEIVCRYSLNGEERKVSISISSIELFQMAQPNDRERIDAKTAVVEKIHAALAKDFAMVLTVDMVEKTEIIRRS